MTERRLFEEPQPYREAMNRGDWDQAISLLQSRAAAGEGGRLAPEEELTLATLRGLRGEVNEALDALDRLAQSPSPHLAVRARVQSVLLRTSGGGGYPDADAVPSSHADSSLADRTVSHVHSDSDCDVDPGPAAGGPTQVSAQRSGARAAERW